VPAGPFEPIVGIDLGTTNSLVAIAAFPPGPAGAAPRILPDGFGRPLCPSAVHFPLSGGSGLRTGVPAAPQVPPPPVIGQRALELGRLHPGSTITSVKRLMGRALADAQDDLPYLPYRVVAGPGGAARVELPADPAGPQAAPPRLLSPQEVSAHILRHLRDQASRALGVPVRQAVVTVPAYFDDAQRQATRDAARLAGLDAVRILNEPTAAALAYGVGLRSAGSRAQSQLIAVYDLGGGTFDVSILRVVPGQPSPAQADRPDAQTPTPADFFQVISTAGDTRLGGDDFDHALVDHLMPRLADRLRESPGAPTVPARARAALRDAARRARHQLSEHATATIDLSAEDLDLGPGGRSFRAEITRARFEELVAPLVERTLESCRRALRDAQRSLAGEALSAVVLVGGVTRTPLVRRRVAEFFDLEPYTALDPDQVVALGAAVQASILSGASRQALLLDVVPLSLGVETVGGAVAKLIHRNSSVPARASERFSTSVDAQTSIKIHVLQGEREMAADCRSLGLFHLSGIPPMPAGIPRLRVDFLVDASGVLNVSAVEERSGKRAALQVVPTHGLTPEEVDRLERESFQHARADLSRRRVADLTATAALDLHWVGRQFAAHAAALAPDEHARLAGAIDILRDLVGRAKDDWQGVDAAALEAAKRELDAASVRLHEVSIAASLAADPALRAPGGAGPRPGTTAASGTPPPARPSPR